MKSLRLGGIRHALVIAPHPDDEAIGAYGLIRSLKRNGARVRIIVVTDGAASHPASARWPRPRLVAERRRETRRAMRQIGVPADDIRFLGLPDGDLAACGASASGALLRSVKALGRGGLIVAPHASDAHPDHRAVARLAARVRSPGTRRLAYLVWPDRTGPVARPTHGVRLGAARGAKRAAIRRYRTQMGAITDDPGGFSISRQALAAFTRPIELFSERPP
jgi:LmbE family N-acetylglucosaminyl deacetylase